MSGYVVRCSGVTRATYPSNKRKDSVASGHKDSIKWRKRIVMLYHGTKSDAAEARFGWSALDRVIERIALRRQLG